MSSKQSYQSFRWLVRAAWILPFAWLVWRGATPLNTVEAVERLTIAYPGPSMFFLPSGIAQRRGFFKEQNLEGQLLVLKSEVDRTALTTGSIDYTLRVGSTFLSTIRGLPVKIVFSSTRKPFWALMARPEIRSVKELKGKVLGVSGFNGAEHLATKAILQQHGLNPDKDAIYTVVAIGQRLPAIKAGAIGGGLMTYSEAFLSKKAGFNMLLNAADYVEMASSGLGLHERRLRENPDQVKRLIRATLKGLRYIRENREGTLQVMMSWLEVDREMAAEVYALSVNNYTEDGLMTEKTFHDMVKTIKDQAGIKEEVLMSKLADFTLVREVLREGQR